MVPVGSLIRQVVIQSRTERAFGRYGEATTHLNELIARDSEAQTSVTAHLELAITHLEQGYVNRARAALDHIYQELEEPSSAVLWCASNEAEFPLLGLLRAYVGLRHRATADTEVCEKECQLVWEEYLTKLESDRITDTEVYYPAAPYTSD